MNYEAAILYAQQRMREVGKTPDQYHFEPVRVSPTDYEQTTGTIIIYAFNEIYILVHPENYFGLFILSDNSSFNSNKPRESGAPEFTGIIRIVRTQPKWNLDIDFTNKHLSPVPIEFLRVVIY